MLEGGLVHLADSLRVNQVFLTGQVGRVSSHRGIVLVNRLLVEQPWLEAP